MWIVKIALSRPYTFIVLAILILIAAPVEIMRTPTDIFPNINIPVISVAWAYTGLNPEELEGHYLDSPYIKEICVLGLEGGPGDPHADKLYAVIVPNFEVLRQRKVVNAKEVIRYDVESLSAKLPSTKRIGSYVRRADNPW